MRAKIASFLLAFLIICCIFSLLYFFLSSNTHGTIVIGRSASGEQIIEITPTITPTPVIIKQDTPKLTPPEPTPRPTRTPTPIVTATPLKSSLTFGETVLPIRPDQWSLKEDSPAIIAGISKEEKSRINFHFTWTAGPVSFLIQAYNSSGEPLYNTVVNSMTFQQGNDGAAQLNRIDTWPNLNTLPDKIITLRITNYGEGKLFTYISQINNTNNDFFLLRQVRILPSGEVIY